jgi:hypothetical protein
VEIAMLPEDDIAKLCRGRIIYAKELYRSDGKDATGAHYVVIVDSDEEIQANETYYVVGISNDDEIDPFRLPVFPRTGLRNCAKITSPKAALMIRCG